MYVCVIVVCHEQEGVFHQQEADFQSQWPKVEISVYVVSALPSLPLKASFPDLFYST